MGVNWEWQGVDICHTLASGRPTPVVTEESRKRRVIEKTKRLEMKMK